MQWYNPRVAIVLHVIMAVASIAAASLALLKPNEAILKISYSMIAGTVASGAFLISSKQAAWLPTCETGLIYLTISLAAVFAARRRLVTQKARVKNVQ